MAVVVVLQHHRAENFIGYLEVFVHPTESADSFRVLMAVSSSSFVGFIARLLCVFSVVVFVV